MTTTDIHAKQEKLTPTTGVRSQWGRIGLSALSGGIGIYQITAGHGIGAVFSFFMAGTFTLSVACERAIARARRDGDVVPTSMLILVGSAGMVISGAVVLGVLVAIRGF